MILQALMEYYENLAKQEKMPSRYFELSHKKLDETPEERVTIAGTVMGCEIQICFFPICSSLLSQTIFFMSPSLDKLIP